MQLGAAPYMNHYISHKSVGKALEEIDSDKLFYRLSDRTDLSSRYE